VKRVHVAATLVEAQLASDALSSLGITNHIFNAHAAGALGEVPFLQAQPEIWIEEDSRENDALETLLQWRTASCDSEKTCAACGGINPGNFLSCWQCGQALPA
jgi:hypothetical protein